VASSFLGFGGGSGVEDTMPRAHFVVERTSIGMLETRANYVSRGSWQTLPKSWQ